MDEADAPKDEPRSGHEADEQAEAARPDEGDNPDSGLGLQPGRTHRERPTRRRRLAVQIAFLLYTSGLIAWGLFTWPHPAGRSVTPSSNPQPAAHISFLVRTQPVSAPQSVLRVASDGSSPISAKHDVVSIPDAASTPIPAEYHPGSHVTVVLTVSLDPSYEGTTTSPAGRTIFAAHVSTSCVLLDTITLSPTHRTDTQRCTLPDQTAPELEWLNRDYAPVMYMGTSPAGGSPSYYSVPDNCGDPMPGLVATNSALRLALQRAEPDDARPFFGPIVDISPTAVTCVPAAGTTAPSYFTYKQHLGGAAKQASYIISDIAAFQRRQLESAASAFGPMYRLMDHPEICPNGPRIVPGTSSPDEVTISCPALGLAEWKWDVYALIDKAKGRSRSEAIAAIESLPGVVLGTVQITLDPKATRLPTDAAAIGISATIKGLAELHVTPFDETVQCSTGEYPAVTLSAQSSPLDGLDPLTGDVSVNWFASSDDPAITIEPASGTLSAGSPGIPVTAHGIRLSSGI